MKRHAKLLVICAPVLAALLYLALVTALQKPAGAGTLTVRVLDGKTDEPVENARVVIPEAALTSRTDESGRTGRLSVPIERDARFDAVLRKDWGEITLLVYAYGYYPAALFFVQVQNKRDRIGPTVYLFPDDGSLSAPYGIVEAPPDAWTEELIASYTPE